jgi:hypothetical protein
MLITAMDCTAPEALRCDRAQDSRSTRAGDPSRLILLESSLAAERRPGSSSGLYGRSRKSLVFHRCRGTTGRSDMTVNRIALIGLSVLGLTATIALAQNTSNPIASGNTTNPILSGNTVTQLPPVPISPAPNTTILQPPLGRNAHTGLPCTGPGPIAVTAGPGTPVGTIAAPGASQLPQNGAPVTPPPTSVFGSSPSC